MTEEQITNRYVRGWISLAEYRAELVKFYDRKDAREKHEREQRMVAAYVAEGLGEV